MVLALDTAATVKMTLYTNNDSEGGWSGTDGPDTYFVLIQGSNSESWVVAKNASETGTLTKTVVNISGTGNHFNVWMKSDLEYYYTDIRVRIQSTAGNYREYIVTTSSARYVTGEFHCMALDINNGGTPTGTLNTSSVPTIVVIVDNTSSGNIRSVTNNWIDAMYWGRGLTFDGSSTASIMFAEAAAIDELVANKFGVMTVINEQIFVQGDIVFDDNGSANTQASDGENVVFTYKPNATNTYRLILIGSNNTVTFTNTNISATGTARFLFDASGTISSFDIVGGGLKKASSVLLKSGQTVTASNFTECGAVDTNGATLNGCNFISTIETVTGALLVNSDIEGEACSNLSFTDFGSNYAVYVAASVTEFDMISWNFDNNNGAGGNYALYWAGTSGTLTINAQDGTNLTTAGCTAASGGSVVVISPVVFTVTGLVAGTEVRLIKVSDKSEIDGVESTVGTTYVYNYTYSGDISAHLVVLHLDYTYQRIAVILGNTNQTIPIQLGTDRNYANP